MTCLNSANQIHGRDRIGLLRCDHDDYSHDAAGSSRLMCRQRFRPGCFRSSLSRGVLRIRQGPSRDDRLFHATVMTRLTIASATSNSRRLRGNALAALTIAFVSRLAVPPAIASATKVASAPPAGEDYFSLCKRALGPLGIAPEVPAEDRALDVAAHRITAWAAGSRRPSRRPRGSRAAHKAGVGGHRARRRSRHPAQHRRPRGWRAR